MLMEEARSVGIEVVAEWREVEDGAACVGLAATGGGHVRWGAAARGPPRVPPSYHTHKDVPGRGRGIQPAGLGIGGERQRIWALAMRSPWGRRGGAGALHFCPD